MSKNWRNFFKNPAFLSWHSMIMYVYKEPYMLNFVCTLDKKNFD